SDKELGGSRGPSHQDPCRSYGHGSRRCTGKRRALARQGQARNRQTAATLSGRSTMALAEQHGRTDLSAALERAGLPRDSVAAWLDSDDGLSGDFSADAEKFSCRWRLGADLLARLPARPARSQAQAAALAAIVDRDRAARAKFLDAHVETLYRRLT